MAKKSYLTFYKPDQKAGMYGKMAGVPTKVGSDDPDLISAKKATADLFDEYKNPTAQEAKSWWRREMQSRNPDGTKRYWTVAENMEFPEFLRFWNFYKDPTKNPMVNPDNPRAGKEWPLSAAELWVKANPSKGLSGDGVSGERGRAILLKKAQTLTTPEPTEEFKIEPFDDEKPEFKEPSREELLKRTGLDPASPNYDLALNPEERFQDNADTYIINKLLAKNAEDQAFKRKAMAPQNGDGITPVLKGREQTELEKASGGKEDEIGYVPREFRGQDMELPTGKKLIQKWRNERKQIEKAAGQYVPTPKTKSVDLSEADKAKVRKIVPEGKLTAAMIERARKAGLI